MTTIAETAPADSFRALQDTVARARVRARLRRIAELRNLLADLDRRRRAVVDELACLTSHESRGGGVT